MRKAIDLRRLILNPKGIEIKPTRNFARPRPTEDYIDQCIMLHRAEKPLEKNTVAFKLMPYKYSMTKPEIKQYLEKRDAFHLS